MTEAERRAALAAAVRRGSRPGSLARACLLVARGEYPHLDPTVSLAELARLTSRVSEAMAEGMAPPWRALSEVLGRSEGFGGNVEDYDNPENSYLNRVLAHRHGLPILLSVIWIEVARGAGIPAWGVGLPGRFIVVAGRGRQACYVDPFERGRRISVEKALEIARESAGDPLLLPEDVLRPATPRRIVLRVLANLANSYERRGDVRRELRVVSDQLALAPEDPRILARRGELRARGDDVSGGLADLNRALAGLPAGDAFERVRENARRLARLVESRN